MATLRTISQTGKEANWKKDKQAKLSSLEDWQFYTFADLDFMNRSQTIVASFKNFSTEDIVQTEGILKVVKDDDDNWEPGTGGRVRVYYKALGSDYATEPFNPSFEGELIQSPDLGFSMWREGMYDSVFPGYDLVTLKKKVYPIYDLGVKIEPFINFSIGQATVTNGSDIITIPGDSGGLGTSLNFIMTQINSYNRELYMVPVENNYLAEESYLISVVSTSESETELQLNAPAIGDGTIEVFAVDNLEVHTPYVVLKNHLEDPDGIEWSDDYIGLPASSYQWQVLQEAPFEDDITINDARFLEKDKMFRGEI